MLSTKRLWLSGVALLALSSVAHAGGYGIVAEVPGAGAKPAEKDAALVVRTAGCHQATADALTGTAEGIVNGRRRSVPVRLDRVARGAYALRRQAVPAEGRWVLVVRGVVLDRAASHALVDLKRATGGATSPAKGGARELPVRLFWDKSPTAAEIDAALAAGDDRAVKSAKASR